MDIVRLGPPRARWADGCADGSHASPTLAHATVLALTQARTKKRAIRESRDVVDGHIAVIALDREALVLTSDPADIARWGVPRASIVTC
jgi:hypothetical protein